MLFQFLQLDSCKTVVYILCCCWYGSDSSEQSLYARVTTLEYGKQNLKGGKRFGRRDR